MNAYELADLMLDVTDCESSEYYQAGVMLRQQADRIKELEVYEEQVKKIKSRKDLLNFILEDSVYPKPKPLSDEEIYQLWCESDNTELLPEMRNKDGSINYIILTFAQLLEERHGIK